MEKSFGSQFINNFKKMAECGKIDFHYCIIVI